MSASEESNCVKCHCSNVTVVSVQWDAVHVSLGQVKMSALVDARSGGLTVWGSLSQVSTECESG